MTEPLLPVPLYLGPQLPRWQPATAADVQRAIDSGAITERHWLDVKLNTKTSTDGNNKEIAADLASFANDGGALIYGVSEDKAAKTFTIAPFDLSGQAERIDEVARSRCDPPLYVACHPLPASSDDCSQGLLLVEIPPSPSAPHMVDGRYYGRGDTTKRRLTDGEVARLHAVRTMRHLTAEQLIEREITRDPIPADGRDTSHVYVVARPLAAPPDLLTETIERRTLGTVVLGFHSRLGNHASPNWGHLSSQQPRAQGWGVHSHVLTGRRLNQNDKSAETAMVDLEIGDDGSLSLVCGRGSDYAGDSGQQYILDAVATLFTRGVVELAGQLGRDHGYGGRWLIAVGLTDLEGKHSAAAFRNMFGEGLVPFSADRYIEATEAVTSELLAQPGAVTRRLVRRLLRGLGTTGQSYGQLLTDPRPGG
ncbi:ATP-binding protein [Micromonospora echinofusca]|uniref:AlbA family DNA-binding domain-containing protein n=1 Tax=Micromonospora echinofusca TaxID=47858 RepID=UPI003440EB32